MKIINPSLRHCIWLEEIDCAFVYIPKTACTSWKLFLWQLRGNIINKKLSYSNVHNDSKLKLPYVYKMSRSKQEEFVGKLEKQEINVCSVVREPYSRVLSGYLDKVLLHSNPNSLFSKLIIPEIKKYHAIDVNTAPSFLQFLQWNHDIRMKEQLNDHWRPATELLGLDPNNNNMKSNNIRFWPMTRMKKAADWFNGKFQKNIIFPSSQELGTRKTNSSEEQIESYFGEEEKAIFESIYEKDMLLYKSLEVGQ